MTDQPRWTENRTRCRACGVRWGQAPRWLCRQCDRARGTFTPPTHTKRHCRRCGVAAETQESLCAACWQRVGEELAAALQPTAEALVREGGIVVVRERVVRGRAYVVVWDGSKR